MVFPRGGRAGSGEKKGQGVMGAVVPRIKRGDPTGGVVGPTEPF